MLRKMELQQLSVNLNTTKFPYFEDATVCGWKNAYCKELLLQSSTKHELVEIEELPQKHRGRPLLLGEELKDEMKCCI